ncbi:MAG: RDD family protein [Deltaproteobacteria bacterium]|nr:RDD family protein [Deltaproteobacteria bacterium]MBT8373576.1 RDD family protein [Deltaproteobacteria bacterium]
MSRGKSNTLTIRTPEGVVFSLQLAGPVTRFMSWVIDLACISAISSILNIFFKIIGMISHDFAMAVGILSYFLVSIGYGITTEWYWQGQTLGKRLLRLRVMDEQGLRLQFSQIVIRNLLRFVDSLPLFYMVGGMACLISKKAQRLGDFAANTLVVWNPSVSKPDLNQILEGKYNSFRQYPHIEARLRQRISPQEAGIALQAIMRREEIDPNARIELFNDIVSYFKTVVEFPQEATDGISDEQYLRNVVDALYRTKAPVI